MTETMRAVALDGPGPPEALTIRDLALGFDSDLDWATFGAVPEMLQTAFGSLTGKLVVTTEPTRQ